MKMFLVLLGCVCAIAAAAPPADAQTGPGRAEGAAGTEATSGDDAKILIADSAQAQAAGEKKKPSPSGC